LNASRFIAQLHMYTKRLLVMMLACMHVITRASSALRTVV